MIKSSGLLSAATALIYTGHCRLRGVSLSPVAAKTTTLTVYDGLTSAVGTTKVVAYGVTASTAAGASATNFVIKFSEEDNLDCETGLCVVLSTVDEGKYIIYYEIL